MKKSKNPSQETQYQKKIKSSYVHGNQWKENGKSLVHARPCLDCAELAFKLNATEEARIQIIHAHYKIAVSILTLFSNGRINPKHSRLKLIEESEEHLLFVKDAKLPALEEQVIIDLSYCRYHFSIAALNEARNTPDPDSKHSLLRKALEKLNQVDDNWLRQRKSSMLGTYYKIKSVIHKYLAAFEREKENRLQSVSALEQAGYYHKIYANELSDAYKVMAAYFRQDYDKSAEEKSLELAAEFSQKVIQSGAVDAITNIFYFFDNGRLLFVRKNITRAYTETHNAIDLIGTLQDNQKSKEIKDIEAAIAQMIPQVETQLHGNNILPAQPLKQSSASAFSPIKSTFSNNHLDEIKKMKKLFENDNEEKYLVKQECIGLKEKIIKMIDDLNGKIDSTEIEKQRRGILRVDQLYANEQFENAKPKLQKILSILSAASSKVSEEKSVDLSPSPPEELSQMFPNPKTSKKKKRKPKQRKVLHDQASQTEKSIPDPTQQIKFCNYV